METCDEIFAHYYDHWADEGGLAIRGWGWWWDGTVRWQKSGYTYVDVAGGGNKWPNLSFDDYYDYSLDNKTLLQEIDARLQQGYGVGLGISKGAAVGHAITCWGVNYNTSYNPGDPTYNKYIGIWVTDSDDNKGDDFALPWLGNAGIQNRLRYYTVGYSVADEKWYFTGPGWFDYGGWLEPGWYIDMVSWLAGGPGIVPKVAAGSDQTVDEAVTVYFDGSYKSPGPAPTIKWDFGDGSTDTGSLTPSHAYSNDGVYTVTLTITDDQGDWATDTLTVKVLKVVPTAYAGSDQTADEGDTVSFSGSYSYSGAGTLAIAWDFGDGSTAAGTLTPQHQYADDGKYIVTLTVTDHNGDVGTDTLIVTVKNVAPTLTLGGAASTDEGAIYTLTLQVTDPGDDTITAWGIDWGDGFSEIIVGNPTAVNHTYADGPNSWTIQANATDEDGTWAAVNMLAVTVLNVAPTVCIVSVVQAQPFTLAEWIVLMRDPFVATGNASDPGSDDLTFNWSWGDGLENVTFYLNDPPTYPVAIVEILEHTYMEPGEYFLTLTVEDDDGGVGTATVTLTVWGPRDLKTNVLAELEALKTGEKCIDRRLDRVIRCIECSLYQTLWMDETHLDPYWGWCVFLFEHLAEVHLELRSELYEHLIPILEEWIECWQAKGYDTTWLEAKLARMQTLLPVFEAALYKLAKADELLARVAITDAENTPVQNTKWQHKVDSFLLKANQHLANATTYLEMEQFGTAICHYKVAWMFAQKAMKWATKSGSGGWGC
ncbi:MAG: PKD domain-containing protein [Candidatus Hodarchaeales archaeon]